MSQGKVEEKQNSLCTSKSRSDVFKTIFTSISSETNNKRLPFYEKVFTPFENSKYSNDNYKVDDVLNGLHLLYSGKAKNVSLTNRDTAKVLDSLKQIQNRNLTTEENKLKRMVEKIELSHRKLIKDVYDLEMMYDNYKTNNKSCLDLKNIRKYVIKNEIEDNFESSNSLVNNSEKFRKCSSLESNADKQTEMRVNKVLKKTNDAIKLSKSKKHKVKDTKPELDCLYNSFENNQWSFSKSSFKRRVKEKDKIVKKVIKKMIKNSQSISSALDQGKNVRVEVEGLPPIVIKSKNYI